MRCRPVANLLRVKTTRDSEVYVANATELQNAISNSDVKKITLTSDISIDCSLNRLVNFDFGGKTLTGNVTVNTNEAGTLTFSNGSITGNLTVTTPNATVNNYAGVTGELTINDVSSGTWNEFADGNSIMFNDPNPNTHLNIAENKTVENLTVNSTGAIVKIGQGAVVTNMELTESATGTSLTVNGTVTSLNINANGIDLLGNGVVTTMGGSQTPASTQPTVINHRPAMERQIEDQTLYVGGSSLTLQVGNAFSDIDGDTLTYTVTSSDSTVANASVTGDTLTISPKKIGTTRLKITASDGNGGRVNQSFNVNCLEMLEGDATIKLSDTAETSYTIGDGTITNVPSGKVADLKSDVVPNKSSAAVKVLSSTNTVTNAEEFNAATELSSTMDIETGMVIAVMAENGTVKTYTITLAPTKTVENLNFTLKQRNANVTINLSPYMTEYNNGDLTLTETANASLDGKLLKFIPENAGTQILHISTNDKIFNVNITSVVQGQPEAFFSEYMDAGDGRIALEVFHKDNGTGQEITGYELEIHRYMQETKSKSIITKPILKITPNMTYHFMNSIFYDFFDIMNVWYYNDEEFLYQPNMIYTTAIVLKRNGQIIDILGDVNSSEPFMKDGGTIVRQRGIYTGSKSFDIGEWDIYPKGTLNFYGNHIIN
ncbi:Ig-like domain-containing protein [Cytobacillus massiliigabonensis]|uniref:Ig-like domain-containing protein n=1 Tax=Cytobacillus massiliigabonensis TaxID=1871011 RepID=UPI000C822F87|nr:hypothetical protein [Cytobacillus massiliigabonensis]